MGSQSYFSAYSMDFPAFNLSQISDMSVIYSQLHAFSPNQCIEWDKSARANAYSMVQRKKDMRSAYLLDVYRMRGHHALIECKFPIYGRGGNARNIALAHCKREGNPLSI